MANPAKQNFIPKIDIKTNRYKNQDITMIDNVLPVDRLKPMTPENIDYSDYIQNIYPNRVYQESTARFPRTYFTQANVEKIQEQVAKGLDGSRDDGKRTIVSRENVLSVMASVLQSKPRTGIENVILMVSSMIINMIKNEYDTIKKNFSYNIDVLRYDGTYGIRQHPIIKLVKKRVTSGWNYNY